MLEAAAAVYLQSSMRVSVTQSNILKDLDQSIFTKSLEPLPIVSNAPKNEECLPDQ